MYGKAREDGSIMTQAHEKAKAHTHTNSGIARPKPPASLRSWAGRQAGQGWHVSVRCNN